MIDREYVKLNTSIQTGSNSSTLLHDDEGNIEASLELRLPDNLFSGNRGPKKIDKVEMQTSKFRLSMENTPIAALPIITEESNQDVAVSSCQLDVYPFVRDGENKIKKLEISSLPYYKKHFATLNFFLHEEQLEPGDLIYMTIVQCNINGIDYSQTLPFYSVVTSPYVTKKCCHMMNLCTTLSPLKYEGNKLMIQDIEHLARILQDAIENALTYASTESQITVEIHLVAEDLLDEARETGPKPHDDISTNYHNKKYYLWYLKFATSKNTNHLGTAFKPMVRFSEQAISISYDTAPFEEIIPILWNPSFIESGSYPPQLTLDDLRKEVWQQPPPKRVYKYGTEIMGFNADNGGISYNFTLPADFTCAVMNIVANKTFKDMFSFLPWIPIAQSSFEKTMNGDGFLIQEIKETSHTTRYATETYAYSGGSSPTDDNPYGWRVPVRVLYPQGVSWIQRKAITYTSSIYSANPDNVVEQSIQLGTVYQGRTFNLPGVCYSQDFDPPNTTTNEEILSSTTTTISPLPSGGSGKLVTDIKTTSDLSEKQYEPGGVLVDPEYQCVVYYENGRWVVGKKIEGGTWDSSVSYGQIRRVPPRTPDDVKFFTTVVDNGIKMTQQQIWYLPTDPNTEWVEYMAVANEPLTNSGYVHYTENYHETRMYLNVSEVPNQEMKDTEIIPNLSLSENEKLYILDGTGCEVKIGEVEPIYDRYGTFTGRSKIETVTTTTEHYQQEKIEDIFVNTTYHRPTDGDTFENIYASLNTWRVTPNTFSQNYLTDAYDRKYFFVRYQYDLDNDVRKNEYCYIIDKEAFLDGTMIREAGNDRLLGTDPVFQRYCIAYNYDGTAEDLPIPDPTTTIEYSNELLPESSTTTTVTRSIFTSSTEWVEGPDDRKSEIRTVGFNLYLLETGGTINLNKFKRIWFEPMDNPKYQPDPEDNAPGYFNFRPPSNEEGLNPYRRNILTGAGINGSDRYIEDYLIVSDDIVQTVSIGISIDYVSVDGFNFDLTFAPFDMYVVVGDCWDLTSTREYFTENIEKTISTEDFPGIKGNVRLTFTWDNLPIVTISPIQSIVLSLTGIQLNQEYQPVNIAEKEGSSLTSTIPVVENYYSLAETLRDLHDELVVTKESFDDTATYTLSATSGQERVLHFSAKYIAKDGSLHQIYIPPNGVFSIQLTFGISYYIS